MMTANPKARRYFALVLLGLGVLLAIQMSLNIWKVYRSGNRIVEAKSALDAAQKEQAGLQSQLSYVQSPEFIEKQAREKLGMGRPDEVVLILPKFGNKPPETVNPELAVWQKWWHLYIGI